MQVSHIKQLYEKFYLRSKQNEMGNTIINTLNINSLTSQIFKKKIIYYLQ